MVQPFIRGPNRLLQVFPLELTPKVWNSPWRFVSATLKGMEVAVSAEFLSDVMREANRTAASRVVVVLPQGGLLVGLLNQLRFWSLSRARLCGLHIVRQQLEAFRPR